MRIVKPYTSSAAMKLDTLISKAADIKKLKLKTGADDSIQTEIFKCNLKHSNDGFPIGASSNITIIEPVKNFKDVIKSIFGKAPEVSELKPKINLWASSHNATVFLKRSSDIKQTIDPSSLLNIQRVG